MREVSRHIAESRDLDAVLQETVDAIRSLTDARHGAVGVLDDTEQVHTFVTSGLALEEEPDVGTLL